MLGTLVVFYLFLGGCGAGILCVTALWSLAFHYTKNRSDTQTDTFSAVKVRCYLAGFGALCVASLCLLLDLGRPELFYLLFTRPTMSIITFGSYTLAFSLLVSGFLVAANLFYIPQIHALARKIAEVLCVVASLCMMIYTGVYVACVEAVPLWNNVAIPALFLFSSLSAGCSAVFMVASLARDVDLLDGWIEAWHRFHLWILALELLALAVFVGISLFDPATYAALDILFGAEAYGYWLIVGALGMGLVVPCAVEAYAAITKSMLRMFPVDALCIAGGLVLRVCVIWSGMH